MKRLSPLFAIALCSLAPTFVLGQRVCRTQVRTDVTVATPSFALADLLMPGTCHELLAKAADVRLGATPARGSTRVFEGEFARAALQKLIERPLDPNTRFEMDEIPERITIHPKAGRSCRDLLSDLERERSPESGLNSYFETVQENQRVADVDCGGADGVVPEEATLRVTKEIYDPALKQRLLFVRCWRFADCVPFIVRIRIADAGDVSPRIGASPVETAPAKATRKNLYIRAGQRATLVWEESGIRSMVLVTCLDSGELGDSVRVRLSRQPKGTFHAVVAGFNLLRKS